MKTAHFQRHSSLAKRQQPAIAALGLALTGLAPMPSALASPTLSFDSYAQVYGYLNTQYSSALLGNVSFSLNGQSDYQGSYSNSNPRAQASYSVPAGANNGISDPIYDVVTNFGQYGYSYDGEAQVLGTNLKTKMSATVTDASGNLVNQWDTPTSLYAYSMASWIQEFYIAPTASKARGSYGAILVGATLDGHFPALVDSNVYNNASAYLRTGSSFQDLAGVSYDSWFDINTDAGNSGWSGAQTVYKKLLFQYGTPFRISLNQWASAYGNGNADFFNTGYISAIELPFGAVLDSGAQQAGLGAINALYGRVYNSETADAENTNWDFGNNGGGFTPPPSQVPLPSAAWGFCAGLMGLLATQRNRKRSAV